MCDNRLLDLGQSANPSQNVGCASLILNAKAISVGHPGGTLLRSIELFVSALPLRDRAAFKDDDTRLGVRPWLSKVRPT
jgi:hypothetical protein